MLEFTLQIALTDVCGYKCSHCYIETAKKDTLSVETWKKVIDQHAELCDQITDLGEYDSPVLPIIHFTGGDPLKYEGIFELLDYTKSKNIKSGILGTPDLIDDEMAQRLSQYNLKSFQISIDGNREYHDKLRNRKGSWDQSWEAFKTLHKNGIDRSFVMCNVTAENYDQIPELFEACKQNNIWSFTFARVCNTGRGTSVNTDIKPDEYRKMLNDISKGDILAPTSSGTKLVLKEPLWALHAYENGYLDPSNEIEGGCQAGISLMTIDAYGNVQSCRRIGLNVANIQEQSLWDIYLENDHFNEMRDFESKECRDCPLINHCRGCPAISYGKFGDINKKDPQCWYQNYVDSLCF